MFDETQGFSQGAESWECPVCYETIKPPQSRAVMMCGHSLCGLCWVKWNAADVCRLGGIRYGVQCPTCRAPAGLDPQFDSLCDRRDESLISESMGQQDIFKWCAGAFTAYTATVLKHTHEPPFDASNFAKDQHMAQTFTDLCYPEKARQDLFELRSEEDKAPRWKRDKVLWCLRQWYTKIISKLFPRSDQTKRLTVCWLCVWAHSVWSVFDVTVQCTMIQRSAVLSVSSLTKLKDVKAYLNEFYYWCTAQGILDTFRVNGLSLNSEHGFKMMMSPTTNIEWLLGRGPTIFNVVFWFEGLKDDTSWATEIAGSIEASGEPNIRKELEHTLKIALATADMGSELYTLMHQKDVCAEVTWDHNSKVYRFDKVPFKFAALVLQGNTQDILDNPNLTIVRKRFGGSPEDFEHAAAAYLLFCMKQMQGVEPNDTNRRIYNALKKDAETIGHMSLLNIFISTPESALDAIIESWIGTIYYKNRSIQNFDAKYVDDIQQMATQARTHFIFDAESPIVFVIVGPGNQKLCVPMKQVA